MLDWCLKNGCRLHKKVPEDALKYGPIALLDCLKANGCRWPKNGLYIALRGHGVLTSLKLAKTQGAEWCAANVPWNLGWIEDFGADPEGDFWASSQFLTEVAIRDGHAEGGGNMLGVIKWLREEIQPPCPWNERALEYATQPRIINYLRINGAPRPAGMFLDENEFLRRLPT